MTRSGGRTTPGCQPPTDQAAIQLGDVPGAAQLHGHAQLMREDIDALAHAGLARGGQPVQVARPTRTARAPRASAAAMSLPRRNPESTRTSRRSPAVST